MLAGARLVTVVGTVALSVTPARYVDAETGQVAAELMSATLYNTAHIHTAHITHSPDATTSTVLR